MPGTPATTTNFAIPRYANSDAANFASQVNAVSDKIDSALAPQTGFVRPSGDVAATMGATDIPGMTHTFTLTRTCTVLILAELYASYQDFTAAIVPGNVPTNQDQGIVCTIWINNVQTTLIQGFTGLGIMALPISGLQSTVPSAPAITFARVSLTAGSHTVKAKGQVNHSTHGVPTFRQANSGIMYLAL